MINKINSIKYISEEEHNEQIQLLKLENEELKKILESYVRAGIEQDPIYSLAQKIYEGKL